MNSKPIPQRISAFLLCFALLVGLFPSAALAVGEENPVWTIDYPDETITIPAGYSLYTTKTGEESITPSTSTSENSTYNLTPYIQNTQQTLYLQASETGESAETVRTEITIPARPTAPTITTTSVDYTEETLTIMWSSGTLEYNWNSGQPNAVWYTYEGQPIKPVALNTMHWEEEKGGTVYIRSAATNNQFASEANFTNTVTVKARPAAPTELPTIAATTDSITVTAVANQEYKLGEDENWQSAGSNNQVVLSSLEPGTPYIIQYRTKAVVDRGNPGSNQFASCAAQITVTTNYAAPTGLNFMSTVPGEATATWGEVTGATSYTLQLYKGDEKVGGEVTTTGTSHTFTIDAAGTYCFTVKATGDDVDGEVSQNSSDLTFYEVKFDSTGGTDVPSQFVTTEEKPNQPDTPTKSGYAFGGWYKDENFDDEWSFADAGGDDVDGDVTLYAKWLSKNTSVTSVTVNEQSATAGDEENTFNVSLPYGSTLPTESSALSVTMAEGATKGEVTVTTDTAAGTVTYSFTVTAEDQTTQANYTVTVSIAPDPAADNKAAVAAAKAAIEGRADWTVAQATVNTQEAVKTWIEGQLEAINLSGVGYEVTITSITPAVAGSADERDGTDGSFSFTVKLSKGEQTGSEATSTYAEDTATVTGGEITATPYNSWTVAVTAEAGGTVSGGGTFENGSTVTVTATPNSGYRFVRWTEGGAEVSTEESYSFTLTADRSLTAEFSRIASGGRPTGPVTEGGASGWDGVEDEIADAQPGDTVTIDMNGETEVPGTIFEEIAGEDVTVEIDLGGGVSWSVNGTDVPEGVSLASLDLGVSLGTSGISVDVINAVTGEYGSVQITLAHDGEFGFALTLTAPLGRGNAGLWANLYHYDEARERLTFETSARIAADGSAALRMTHASQYAIVIDDKSHAMPFEDVSEGAWYYDAVSYVYSGGLMDGVSATTFAPDANMTRAMLVTILWRMEGEPVVNYLLPFTDVDGGAWYAEAVRWAASEDIVTGVSDTSFAPNSEITREQLAAILHRYAGEPATAANLAGYADGASVSAYAVDAMSWCVEHGIITGTTATTLDPQGTATRAQAAAMLMRFAER